MYGTIFARSAPLNVPSPSARTTRSVPDSSARPGMSTQECAYPMFLFFASTSAPAARAMATVPS